MTKVRQKKNTSRIPFSVEFEREEDGRWIAEVRELPGVMAYGSTKQMALRKVYAIALRTLWLSRFDSVAERDIIN